jgi:hypothetical protein
MSRYKDRQSAKAIEQDFPHFVEVVVPPNGLGNRLDAMYDFHAQRGIHPKRGHGRHDANGSVIRWCFADPALAAAFASEFGDSRAVLAVINGDKKDTTNPPQESV